VLCLVLTICLLLTIGIAGFYGLPKETFGVEDHQARMQDKAKSLAFAAQKQESCIVIPILDDEYCVIYNVPEDDAMAAIAIFYDEQGCARHYEVMRGTTGPRLEYAGASLVKITTGAGTGVHNAYYLSPETGEFASYTTPWGETENYVAYCKANPWRIVVESIFSDSYAKEYVLQGEINQASCIGKAVFSLDETEMLVTYPTEEGQKTESFFL
jgi:hypothetical protein